VKPIFKWTAIVAASCAVTAIVHPRLAHSADHLDGPAVKLDPSTDINDLFSWMDGTNAVFALTVSPAAAAGAKFSDAAQYVVHTSSAATFGGTATNTDIICTFDTTQKIQCWVGGDDYVTGDASAAAGLTSTSGKLKVFAGLRADPFFFNLDGFNHTRATVIGAAPLLAFDDAGCPTIDGLTSSTLVSQLKTSPDGGAPVDFFQNLNTLSIVISVDKSLVTKGGPIVSAWASTNKKP
jgi:hypothetical protein